MRRILVIASLAAALSGCASIVNGLDQPIALVTSPPAADCVATRDGDHLFTARGGDRVTVSKSRHAIELRCVSGVLVGNATVESSLDVVGIATPTWDYMTGALNKYPSAVFITLQPVK